MSAQFEDGKDDGALRTIGEVSKAVGIKTHVLRYWEQQFPMLEPLKRSGGRRYYRPDDIALIERINTLVNEEGYTIKGAKKALESKDEEPAEAVSDDAKPVVAEQTAQPAETTSEALSSPFPAAIPAEDGGVDAFFGKAPVSADDVHSEAGQPQLTEAEPVSEMSDPVDAAEPVENAPETAFAEDIERMPRGEILSKLKTMRSELAEALAA